MQNSIRKIVAVALFLLTFNVILAQTDKGLLVGRVMSETGRPLVSAKLYIVGTQDSGTTDVEGKFSFYVLVGARKVYVEAEGHDLLEDSVFIELGKEYFLNPVLSKTTRMEGAEIVKKKKAKENTVAAAIQTKQLSAGMVEAISAEDFAKTTIRTTSDAIKRIPGATISEGKFANIRVKLTAWGVRPQG